MLWWNFWHCSKVMKWIETCTSSHNWSIPWLVLVTHIISVSQVPMHAPLDLSDWEGQVSTSKFCIDNHCSNNFAVSLWSLSCWNRTGKGLKQYYLIVFVTPSWRMLWYRAWVIFPSILHMQPMLREVIQPHAKIAPPPCLTLVTHMMSL